MLVRLVSNSRPQVHHKVRSSRPAWPRWWHLISTKSTKFRQARWQAPIIPATWEAEAGESLEPGRWGLQWAEIVPLHSSLDNKSETPPQKKKNNNNNQNNETIKLCIYKENGVKRYRMYMFTQRQTYNVPTHTHTHTHTEREREDAKLLVWSRKRHLLSCRKLYLKLFARDIYHNKQTNSV